MACFLVLIVGVIGDFLVMNFINMPFNNNLVCTIPLLIAFGLIAAAVKGEFKRLVLSKNRPVTFAPQNKPGAQNSQSTQQMYNVDSQESRASSSSMQNGIDDVSLAGLNDEDAKIMRAVVNGRKLRQLADKVIASGDCHAESIEQHLLEVFGLLAYEKPEESPLRHVLEPTYRESVCNMLNGAILQSHNMAPDPQLQTLLVQSGTCLQEMASLGIPEATFVNVKDITG